MMVMMMIGVYRQQIGHVKSHREASLVEPIASVVD